MEKFDSLHIDLNGKNLIEASAGTGKTFSITVMALRLILEQKIPLNKILMVTFTEAATAEMAERIRSFIRKAHQYSVNPEEHKDCDEKIKEIVDRLNNPAQVQGLLNKAMQQLDDIHVFTIHGFCQRILDEFALVTKQPFGLKVLTNETGIVTSAVNQYWRRNCTLTNPQMDRESLINEVKNAQNPDNNENNLIAQLHKKVKENKEKQRLVSFNDLIYNLYSIAIANNPGKHELVALIKEKYQVVFIDEFQDTDSFQYEIFSNLFPSQTHFYIGDPKQSIYGFRGADINSYLKIKTNEGIKKYSMNRNYRSTKPLIDSLNKFYALQPDFFGYKEISYDALECSNSKVDIVIDGECENALSYCKEKDSIEDLITKRVSTLLNHGQIVEEGKPARKIQPADIAILCRTNDQTKDIKNALIKLKIPTVVIDDSNILKSDEAKLVVSLLELMLNPIHSTLVSVLATPYMSYTESEIRTLDESAVIDAVSKIRSSLDQQGIYVCLHKLVNLFHDPQKTESRNFGLYDRMKTNLLQVIELIHKKATRENLPISNIGNWMQRQVAGETEKEYEQQLESDALAVKVLTIHKSKGLEFNIVLYPNYKTQSNVENEFYRLLYVAFTRGKFKTDIVSNDDGRSCNVQLLKMLEGSSSCKSTIGKITLLETSEYIETHAQAQTIEWQPKLPVDKSWRTVSFSSMVKHVGHTPSIEELQLSGYDQFVFADLPKGKAAGTFLHSLFEKADFQSSEHMDVLQQQRKHFPRFISHENLHRYNELINNVLHANYHNFSLAGLASKKRLNELEYHLKIGKKVNLRHIDTILGRSGSVKHTDDFHGLLHGFIDMVFEYKGKFYILDWKSNYLGNTVESYNHQSMREAVEEAGYDLQYMVYATALIRYLESRLPNFDIKKQFGGGFWVFLRGCRQDLSHGIYFQKPDWKKLEEFRELFT